MTRIVIPSSAGVQLLRGLARIALAMAMQPGAVAIGADLVAHPLPAGRERLSGGLGAPSD
jgi:hypothetical protein